MTINQKQKINNLLDAHNKKCATYMSYCSNGSCRFTLYENKANSNDKNITIFATYVSGLSDNYQPFYNVVNLLVEPSGDVIELSALLNSDEIDEYYNGLTKIN
ncbi:MAG: hypothetical protein ACOVNU_09300 [Candidatus Kapaibacteriota bacterium]